MKGFVELRRAGGKERVLVRASDVAAIIEGGPRQETYLISAGGHLIYVASDYDTTVAVLADADA